jgi:hypothetical protein
LEEKPTSLGIPSSRNILAVAIRDAIERRTDIMERGESFVPDRFCSLIPGLGVKLSTIILAGPTVLSAVGACPPHDGVR